MENVANIQSIDKGLLYRTILYKMRHLGYNVVSGILCAADFGVPKLRRRMIFIGCRSDLGTVPLPLPTHSEFPSLEMLPLYNTVGDAFRDLPKIV